MAAQNSAKTLKKRCKNHYALGEREPIERLPVQGPEGWRNPLRAKCSFPPSTTAADNTPDDQGGKMTAPIAIACGFSYDSAYDLLKAMAENAAGASASRPLLALLNEYRFKSIALPGINGYLRMRPGDFCKIFPHA